MSFYSYSLIRRQKAFYIFNFLYKFNSYYLSILYHSILHNLTYLLIVAFILPGIFSIYILSQEARIL